MGAFTGGTKLYKPILAETGWDDEVNTNWDRLSENFYNVKSYGAVGNGVADDTVSIQACIDAVDAAGGGMVFLPPGTYKVSQSASLNTVCLRMRDGVVMRGSGWSNCIVQAAANLPAPVVNVIGNDGGDNGNDRWMMGLENFRIDGNRANQTQLVWGAQIHKDGWSAFAENYNGGIVGSAGLYYVDKMFFYNCKGGGFHFTGTSGGQITRCMAWKVQVGYAGMIDSEIIGSIAGVCDLQGFVTGSGSNRFVGCKAFACGATSAAAAAFELNANSNEVTGCEIQEHVGHGFLINGSSNIIQATSVEDINGSVVYFAAGVSPPVSGCIINIVYNDETGLGSGPYAAIHMIDNSNGALHNNVNIQIDATGTTGPTGTTINGTSANNNFTVGNQAMTGGLQVGTYAASFTPFPGNGNYVITLTGNITINAPGNDVAVGSKMGFLLIENATGGWTISFNAIYKTNWTPATTANDKNWIEFVYDGTNWLQTSYTAVAI